MTHLWAICESPDVSVLVLVSMQSIIMADQSYIIFYACEGEAVGGDEPASRKSHRPSRRNGVGHVRLDRTYLEGSANFERQHHATVIHQQGIR